MSNLAGLGKLPDLAALSKLDKSYQETLEGSFLVGPALGIYNNLRSKIAPSKVTLGGKLGQFLQSGSFLFFLLLFALLGLPQFANDKEGLALVSLVSMILFVLGRILGGRRERPMRATDGLVLGYFAANVIAAFASHYLPESIKGLSKVAIYIMSYFLFTASLQGSRKRLVAVFLASLVSGVLVSLYGLYQFKIGVEPLATWEDPTVEEKVTRIYSTLGNPNLLAGYLIPLIPMAFSLGLAALTLKNKSKWLLTLMAFGITAIIAAACVLTASRGAYLALGAMVATYALACAALIFTKKPKLVVPFLLGFVLLSVAAAAVVHFKAPSFEQRFLSIFAQNHSSNDYRKYVYAASLAMFKHNWWFGVGPGNTAFRLAYGLYMTSGFDALGTYCVPLEVGVECGIVGLLFFLALVANAFAGGHVVFWRAGDKVGSIFAIGLTAALVGLSVQGLVDTVFYRPQVHFLFWLVIAALVELRSYKPEVAKSSI